MLKMQITINLTDDEYTEEKEQIQALIEESLPGGLKDLNDWEAHEGGWYNGKYSGSGGSRFEVPITRSKTSGILGWSLAWTYCTHHVYRKSFYS